MEEGFLRRGTKESGNQRSEEVRKQTDRKVSFRTQQTLIFYTYAIAS